MSARETVPGDRRWVRTAERRPPSGWEGVVMRSDGHETRLVYERPLWWLPDRSMYVYYQPVMWAEEESPARPKSREGSR